MDVDLFSGMTYGTESLSTLSGKENGIFIRGGMVGV